MSFLEFHKNYRTLLVARDTVKLVRWNPNPLPYCTARIHCLPNGGGGLEGEGRELPQK